MPNRIEMTKSNFVSVLASVASPCGPWLPGEEPIPGWIDPDPDQCDHWREMVMIMKAADSAIDRILGQQRLGESLGDGGSDAVLANNLSDIQRFADDVCETPPRWPLAWPPPRRPLNPKGLTAAQLLIAGARFQAVADHVGDNALQPELAATADRLFEAGLSRLDERRSGMPQTAVRDVCDMMARAIKHIEQEISAKTHRVTNLRERITRLESQPNPDVTQIQELQNDIRELEDQLETDRLQLGAFQDEFAASCGPS